MKGVILPFVKNQTTESLPRPSNGTDNTGQEAFSMTEISQSSEPQEEDEEQGVAFSTTDCRLNKQCCIQRDKLSVYVHAYISIQTY